MIPVHQNNDPDIFLDLHGPWFTQDNQRIGWLHCMCFCLTVPGSYPMSHAVQDAMGLDLCRKVDGFVFPVDIRHVVARRERAAWRGWPG